MWSKKRRSERKNKEASHMATKDPSEKLGGNPSSGKTYNAHQSRSPRENKSHVTNVLPSRHMSVNGPTDIQAPKSFPEYHRTYSTGNQGSGDHSVIHPIPNIHSSASHPSHTGPSQLGQRVVVGETVPTAYLSHPSSVVPNQKINQYSIPPNNKRPSISVPLPSAPLTANILDSLDTTSSGKGNQINSSSNALSGGSIEVGTNFSSSSTSDRSNPSSSGSVGTLINPSHQLQKVIEAQRSQIALLQKIMSGNQAIGTGLTSNVSVSCGQYQGPSRVAVTPAVPSSNIGQDHVTSQREMGPGATATTRFVDRTQTFDYGNLSNKALEHKAVQQQLEKDSCFRRNQGWWP